MIAPLSLEKTITVSSVKSRESKWSSTRPTAQSNRKREGGLKKRGGGVNWKENAASTRKGLQTRTELLDVVAVDARLGHVGKGGRGKHRGVRLEKGEEHKEGLVRRARRRCEWRVQRCQ